MGAIQPQDGKLSYYSYDPNFAAGVLFAVLYTLVSLVAIGQFFYYKSWFWWPMVLCCVMETLGYVDRVPSIKNVQDYRVEVRSVHKRRILPVLGPLAAASVSGPGDGLTSIAASPIVLISRTGGLTSSPTRSASRPATIPSSCSSTSPPSRVKPTRSAKQTTISCSSRI